MTNIGITENWEWALLGVSKLDLITPVMLAVNPSTHAVIVEIA